MKMSLENCVAVLLLPVTALLLLVCKSSPRFEIEPRGKGGISRCEGAFSRLG